MIYRSMAHLPIMGPKRRRPLPKPVASIPTPDVLGPGTQIRVDRLGTEGYIRIPVNIPEQPARQQEALTRIDREFHSALGSLQRLTDPGF